MTISRNNDLYLDWLYDLVCSGRGFEHTSYYKLFKRLHEMDFVYMKPMDRNREMDGLGLRTTFDSHVYFDDKKCSVLEMLVALSLRYDEQIMNYPYPDSYIVNNWFWEMLNNLDLVKYDDINYNDRQVIFIINRFLYRNYDRFGNGNIFKFSRLKEYEDIRNLEIWYQMAWYVNYEINNY